MQNFLQLSFKNPTTGAAINTIYFTDEEVPEGVTRNESTDIEAVTTAAGLARVFTKPVGIQFDFSVILSDTLTINKLDLIQTYISLGYVVDFQALSGIVTASSTTEQPVYSTAKATILNAVIVEFKWFRQAIAKGQVSRQAIPIKIRQGASNALPLSGDWVGA